MPPGPCTRLVGGAIIAYDCSVVKYHLVALSLFLYNTVISCHFQSGQASVFGKRTIQWAFGQRDRLERGPGLLPRGVGSKHTGRGYSPFSDSQESKRHRVDALDRAGRQQRRHPASESSSARHLRSGTEPFCGRLPPSAAVSDHFRASRKKLP